MKSKSIFWAAGTIFLAFGALEFFHAHNNLAAGVNAITGAIFLVLGWVPVKPR